MKIYTVGGAVRDELLGLPVVDRDYVVVGATPEAMLALGFRPVGRDFPVFLHPQTHEEYALARTERKTARGYQGFSFYADPEVSLEEDLARRDLTINAMAKDDRGQIVDPFHGLVDLKAGVLRHVSEAFVEDPVRLLRLARFAARFGFAVAEPTLHLARMMVQNGEVDALVAERVWQELARGLMEEKPSRFFEVLRECGALARIMPEVDAFFSTGPSASDRLDRQLGSRLMRGIDHVASQRYSLEVRFALLSCQVGDGLNVAAGLSANQPVATQYAPLDRLCLRLRVPTACKALALLSARLYESVQRCALLTPGQMVGLLQSADAFRKPDRLLRLLEVCESVARQVDGFSEDHYLPTMIIKQALNAARSVNTAQVAKAGMSPESIKWAIEAARTKAVARCCDKPQNR